MTEAIAAVLFCGAFVVCLLLLRGQTGEDGSGLGCAIDVGKATVALILIIAVGLICAAMVMQAGEMPYWSAP